MSKDKVRTVTIELDKDIYQYLCDYQEYELRCSAESVEELISDLCEHFVNDHRGTLNESD